LSPPSECVRLELRSAVGFVQVKKREREETRDDLLLERRRGKLSSPTAALFIDGKKKQKNCLSPSLFRKQDSKTVCLGVGEPALYLLFSPSSGADSDSTLFFGACQAPLMLRATTTTAAAAAATKATTAPAATAKIEGKSSPKLSWARALSPSGSAAFLDVDWVGAEELEAPEEEIGGQKLFAAAALAFAVGTVASAAALVLLSKARSPANSVGGDDDDGANEGAGDRKQQQREARWAREGVGAGRLRKVSAAAAGGDEGGGGGAAAAGRRRDASPSL
jgi:hypothetical protein